MISKISNSEIGSIHWLNTLLGRQKHIGEILNSKIVASNLIDYTLFGEQLSNITSELFTYYKPRTPEYPITEEERINYLRIALSLQSIFVENRVADEILQTVDKIGELGGKFSIDDSVELSQAIKKKYEVIEPKKQKYERI